MKKLLLLLPVMGMFLFSCEKEDIKDNETGDKKLSQRDSGFSVEAIDNGLDGQILVFDSAEAYHNLQESLFNQSNEHINSYQSQIPRELEGEQIQEFLDSKNFNEDLIYEQFEQSIGFNSFRVKLNKDTQEWLNNQTNPDGMNEENDPDNNTLVLESDRTLFNMGGEVIVLDSLRNPIIYKAFDWGHLVIKDYDTEILRKINAEKIKDYDYLKSALHEKTNISLIRDFIGFGPCSTGSMVNKKHVYSPNNNNNVKTIIKNHKALFPGNGYPDQLIIKSKGYIWKKNKWKHVSLWLVNGFTSNPYQGDHPITWYKVACGPDSGITQLYKARTKCVLKFEYDGGNPKASEIAFGDNSIYGYFGEGKFTFTVDFFGHKNSGHEVSIITY